jgi:hypothetical protein
MHRFDGKALWCSQRHSAHLKKYSIDWRTWYIFIWLCHLYYVRHHHHHETWKETRAGRDRRYERRWRQHEKRSVFETAQ